MRVMPRYRRTQSCCFCAAECDAKDEVELLEDSHTVLAIYLVNSQRSILNSQVSKECDAKDEAEMGELLLVLADDSVFTVC